MGATFLLRFFARTSILSARYDLIMAMRNKMILQSVSVDPFSGGVWDRIRMKARIAKKGGADVPSRVVFQGGDSGLSNDSSVQGAKK